MRIPSDRKNKILTDENKSIN